MEDKLLTTEEAAAYIGYKAGTLEIWRQQNKDGAPPYLKPAGKVLYKKSDLDEWLKNERV